MKSTVYKQTAIAAAICLLIVGCGGGSDTETAAETVMTGVFIDAPVQGLGYQTATQQGITNDAGAFNYKQGETVSFYLDGVELGSAAGATEIPVTMLANTPDIARILQSLDTNPAEGQIDVSSVRLTDAQRTSIPRVLNKSIHISQAGLGDLVDEADVAQHVISQLGTRQWTGDMVTGQLFMDQYEDGATFLEFDSDNTGRLSDIGDFGLGWGNYTWGLDANGNTLNIVLDTDDSHTPYRAKLLAQQNARTLDVSIENLNDQETLLGEFKSPVALTGITGMHLREDTNNNPDCEQRTFSFTETQILEKAICRNSEDGSRFYYIIPWDITAPIYNNVISGSFSSSNGNEYLLHFAMFTGNVNRGRVTQIRYRNGALERIRYHRLFTNAGAPVENPLSLIHI